MLQQALIGLQKALNAGGAGLVCDGVWGLKTKSALEKRLADDAKVRVSQGPPPKHSSTVPYADTPWMDWIKKLEGKSEHDSAFNKFMSKFWKMVGLSFKTIEGASHAWCALTVNAALVESGYKGNGSAAAASFESYGQECDYRYGAIIPMRHRDGSHHVTFFDHWVDEKNKIAACLGGNQGDMIKISNFNLSGNASGHDECKGPRWPVKA